MLLSVITPTAQNWARQLAHVSKEPCQTAGPTSCRPQSFSSRWLCPHPQEAISTSHPWFTQSHSPVLPGGRNLEKPPNLGLAQKGPAVTRLLTFLVPNTNVFSPLQTQPKRFECVFIHVYILLKWRFQNSRECPVFFCDPGKQNHLLLPEDNSKLLIIPQITISCTLSPL